MENTIKVIQDETLENKDKSNKRKVKEIFGSK